jgi:hypothetical protein
MSTSKTPADYDRDTGANADPKPTLAVRVSEHKPPTLNEETLKLSKVLLTGGIDLVGKVDEIGAFLGPTPRPPNPSRLPVRGELYVVDDRMFLHVELAIDHSQNRVSNGG